MRRGMNWKMTQGRKMAQRKKPRRRTRVRARKRPFKYQIHSLSSR
ncbi:hypothetical protein ID866_12194 [Astraeus odoratus]|nr:hypothetical protein ID866_12194 [Astraeus odoratus]